MKQFDGFSTVHDAWYNAGPWPLFPAIRHDGNEERWMTPYMINQSETGQIDAAIHKANRIIEGGCDNITEYFIKAAGLGLSVEFLKDVWDEFWSAKHEAQEEDLADDFRLKETDIM